MLLRQLRVLNGYTLAQLASLLGYSNASSYRKIEVGVQPLKASQLAKLSVFYDVDSDFILHGSYSHGIKEVNNQ